jgi:uncharacterized protein YndB with AHSA1/START domain
MRSPRDRATAAETDPSLPPGSAERVSGYGVMGLPFASGHVLGLRRWTASSVGEPFTSIWHRRPDGRWRFLESAPSEVACSRWFGAGVQESVPATIEITWDSPHDLHVRTADGAVDWTLRLASSPMTRLMSAAGATMPLRAWTSPRVLGAMGGFATRTLGVGRVGLRGLTANGQDFLANPERIWRVTDATAVVDGYDVGAPAPLAEQDRLGDFWIPQRGIFAMGRVFVAARVPQA